MESCSCQLHLQRVQTLSGSKHSKSWFFTCYTWQAARRNADRLTFHAGQQWHDASTVQEEMNLIAISSIFFRGLRPHLSTVIAWCFSIHPQIVFAFCEGNSLTATLFGNSCADRLKGPGIGLPCDSWYIASRQFRWHVFYKMFFSAALSTAINITEGKSLDHAGSGLCVCACLFRIYFKRVT